MSYFTQFPDLLYPSQTPNRNSSFDYVRVKNLFKRAKIREDFFQNATVFDRYNIMGDMRPDQVADKLYKNSQLDWIVLLSNNIINVRNEWPLTQYDFNNYVNRKYGEEYLSQIHHYETIEVRNSYDQIVLQSGIQVNEDFVFKYSDTGINKTLSGSDILTSFSNFDYETQNNDKKRSIYVLRSEYLQVILDDMTQIMTYTDSSQYIDNRTKKGANLRIVSPR
jgi:hypothetical protein